MIFIQNKNTPEPSLRDVQIHTSVKTVMLKEQRGCLQHLWLYNCSCVGFFCISTLKPKIENQNKHQATMKHKHVLEMTVRETLMVHFPNYQPKYWWLKQNQVKMLPIWWLLSNLLGRSWLPAFSWWQVPTPGVCCCVRPSHWKQGTKDWMTIKTWLQEQGTRRVNETAAGNSPFNSFCCLL